MSTLKTLALALMGVFLFVLGYVAGYRDGNYYTDEITKHNNEVMRDVQRYCHPETQR